MGKKIVMGHLFPELLNLYGDLGNITAVKKRCEARGVECEVRSFTIGEGIPFEELDIVLLGGGSDREQRLVGDYLKTMGEGIRSYIEDEKVFLAICGGYQLLGNYYTTRKDKIPGLGIIDMYTEQGEPRLIGNVLLEGELAGKKFPIIGFENHGGRTYHSYDTLGHVKVGYGNNEESKEEGLVYKHTIGTYLHGPLLPKNPEIGDTLIRWALEKKYQEEVDLEPLDDTFELKGRDVMIRRLDK